MNHKKLWGILCILGATIAYALVPSFSFLAFGVGVETETVLFNKFFYASILIWAYIFFKKIPFQIKRQELPMLLAVVLSYIGLATTLYLSYNYISGSLATIISFIFPAFVLAVEMIRGTEPVRLLKISAILGSRVTSGQHWSDSHLLTAWFVTPNCCAKASCVILFCLRNSAICVPNVMCFPP